MIYVGDAGTAREGCGQPRAARHVLPTMATSTLLWQCACHAPPREVGSKHLTTLPGEPGSRLATLCWGPPSLPVPAACCQGRQMPCVCGRRPVSAAGLAGGHHKATRQMLCLFVALIFSKSAEKAKRPPEASTAFSRRCLEQPKRHSSTET